MIIKYFLEIKRLLYSIVTSVFMGIIYAISTNTVNSGNSAAEVFEGIVGYNDFFGYGFANLQGVIILFFLALPLINYYEKNLSKANVYIFPRIKSKSKYFMQKFLCLSLFCLISSLLYTVTKTIIGGDFKLSANLILCFANFFLSLLIFSSLVCLLSVLFGCVRAYLITVIIYCVLIFSVTVCYYNCSFISVLFFIILNPCARFMLNWNNMYFEMMNDFQIKLMSPNVSILYFLTLISIYLIIMRLTVNKFNISLRHYDEE